MAEALVNHLPIGTGRFHAYSAGSHPTGQINPMALVLLQQQGIVTDGLRSKSWDEFATADAPVMDFVFTVCDAAAAETCPHWPGQPISAHWGVPDPAAVEGPEAGTREAFLETFLVLKRRIELFVSLPVEKLSRLALQKHASDIGQQ